MARTDHSHNWAARLSPSLNEIDSIARNAFANLPSRFRVLCDNLVISVTDFPDDQMMDDMGLESPFELLGLFEGQGISERFSLNTGNETNRITLFRRPILDYWTENDEALGDIITHVLIQEIGRNFGLSDDTLDEIEEAVV
ncbi:metallopeptidase family protein [Bartonella apis]|uniref:metallopeptidase family protein n=1 Tax=Bartonella apis TaxID=1686310 RepID=UPI002431F74C|nr:metallopeptidase family protein [Bartonella apis]MCT6861745.1 metallopeptidase family protein [Bartonella apis]